MYFLFFFVSGGNAVFVWITLCSLACFKVRILNVGITGVYHCAGSPCPFQPWSLDMPSISIFSSASVAVIYLKKNQSCRTIWPQASEASVQVRIYCFGLEVRQNILMMGMQCRASQPTLAQIQGNNRNGPGLNISSSSHASPSGGPLSRSHRLPTVHSELK